MTAPPRILHIGQRKTGTTYLQAMLRAAERSGLIHHAHGELGEARKGGSDRSDRSDRSDSFDLARLTEIVRAVPSGDRPSIVSCEPLIAARPMPMAKALHAAWPDATILITTRAPLGYLVSAYFSSIRTGNVKSPKDFGTSFPRKQMMRTHDLDAIVAAYRSTFGDDRVTLLPYEALKNDPAFYARQVGRLLGVDLMPFKDTPIPNPSPPARFLSLLRDVNEVVKSTAPGLLENRKWKRFVAIASRAVAAAPESLDPPSRKPQAADVSAPEMPEGMLERLASRMTILRSLPLYQPYLHLYGLAPAEADAPPKEPAA
jgi:hypothetical protein